jgi:hypothetical protein
MDETSRMARADAMRFQRNVPVEYGVVPEGEKIATPAIDVNGRVFTGPTHAHAIERAERELGVPYYDMQYGPFVDGFITNTGRYVSRWEAWEIARRAEQAKATRLFETPELASEDIKRRSRIKPSSEVRIGATAPGLPGAEGTWGWLPQGWDASAPTAPSWHRTPRPPASEIPNFGMQATEGAAIPLARAWHRSELPLSMDVRGAADHEIAALLKGAWDRGHDAVTLRNYTSPGGRSGDVLVVKDPAQLRDPNARFNPAKRNRRDLLAGGAGAAILAPLSQGDDSQ